MPLTPGTTLGPYEVLSAIGAGGMGEVYKARDTKLDRDVALKILPDAFVNDPERLARFQREAKVLASLNHPNIAAIYGLEDEGDSPALVLEYVEGPTLQDRIAKAPIPLDEALPIARQIAEALEAAHEQGIIHRDLKPANVKVKDDGTVKVLDFGLAKALQPELSDLDAANSPTMTMTAAATKMGVIMGTAAYMSPEQARGKTVDKRADIWAFGVVLYEMLTGRQAFGGDNVTDTLASVVRAEPDWNNLPADTPSGTRRVLRRCLRKDPRERLRDVGDARLELVDTEEATVTTVVPRRASWRLWRSVAALALLIASYAAGVWRSGTEDRAVEWHGELLGGPAFALGPRVSPDGQMLAFEAMVNGLTQVGIMRLQSGQWTTLTDDRSGGLVQDVAWSPDGSSVYFDRVLDVPRGIYRVQVLGGEPRLVLDQAMTPEPLLDGSLVVVRFNEERQRQIFRFWPETGRLDALNGIIAPATLHRALRASPDGREVLFFGRPLDGPVGPDHLYGINLESGALRRLAEATSFGQYDWTFPLAVTRDGAEVLVDIVSGNLHRVVALPRSGSGPPRTLLALTGRPLKIDTGSDGAVYVDLLEQPTEILISDATARDAERMVISNVSATTIARPLPLPDGRIPMTMRIAGRNRVTAVTRGGPHVPLLETQEETSGPMALVGHDTVALMLGSPPDQALALVSTSNGRIERRLDTISASDIGSIAGSPDGRTLYFAAAGQVMALDLETDALSNLHPGEDVAVDPEGEYAVVALEERGGSRLVKVSLADGRVEDIPNRSEFALAADPILEPNAIARDGRIAVRIAPTDLWFWPTGILDPRTGGIEGAWPQIDADIFAGWAEDGRLIGAASFTNSSLWRFMARTP